MVQKIGETERPPYGILAVLMVGAFISFLNNTLLNIALPSIMFDLKVNTATVQWLTTGFMLVNGILIPATAYLIQKYSVRHLFLASMGLFAIGTILGGTAHIFPLLLAARMIQASGSAIMMPLLMNVMLVSFPVERRGAAMGVFGLILMFAPAIGPTLSGWIVEHYSWRMLFHFITPIAVAILVASFFMLKDKKGKVDIQLDFFSLLLSSIGFGGLLYGFSSAGNAGWGEPQVYITIAVGALSLLWFILRQIRQEKPMLNFRVYKYPMFALSSAITMIVNMGLFSGMLLLPIYVQTIRGISPLDAGLMLLPGAIVNAAMSPVNGKIFDKIGGRALSLAGLFILAVTTFMLSRLTLETGYYYLMGLHAVRMFGMSMVFMPVSTNGLNQLPPSYYPHGTAMNNTLNQVAAAIGTAVLITVMSMREAAYAARMGLSPSSPAQPFPPEATVAGINDAFLFSAILIAIAFVLAIFIKRAKPAPEPGLSGEQRETGSTGGKKVHAEVVISEKRG